MIKFRAWHIQEKQWVYFIVPHSFFAINEVGYEVVYDREDQYENWQQCVDGENYKPIN